MTVTIANTNLVDSFNTWRLNTNLAATTISNNVVTVTKTGAARGGTTQGDADNFDGYGGNDVIPVSYTHLTLPTSDLV